mgnify:CR=1 FL=1|jgi:hypothetical protein
MSLELTQMMSSKGGGTSESDGDAENAGSNANANAPAPHPSQFAHNAHGDAPALTTPTSPTPKRARSATAPNPTHAGAKNFIARLRESESEDATRAAATNAAGAKEVSPPPSRDDGADALTNVGVEHENRLDAFEEDAIHALSGLCNTQDDVTENGVGGGGAGGGGGGGGSRAKNTPASPQSKRSKKPNPSSTPRAKNGAGAAAKSGSVSASDGGVGGGGAGAPFLGGTGPSNSRKAADHRRLLKSYMKALFRHLKLPADLKPAGDASYRDRINAALMFWFGDTFAPGKATRECNALKVMASIVYLATKGRVNVDADAVSGVLRKGLNSKNANYTVDEPSLKRLKVTTAELRALFEGPSRVDELGFPCGLPLRLPDDDEKRPRAATTNARRAAAGSDAPASEAVVVVRGARSKRERGSVGGNGVDANGAWKHASIAAANGTSLAAREEKEPPLSAAPTTNGKTPTLAAKTTAADSAADAPADDVNAADDLGSPLFSPTGTVAAAFAAAALAPKREDRRAETRAFIDGAMASVLAEISAHAVDVQLEMLNSAQRELMNYAQRLAKEQQELAAKEKEKSVAGGGPAKRKRGGGEGDDA